MNKKICAHNPQPKFTDETFIKDGFIGKNHPCFLQWNGAETPSQGVKLHISASSMDEYMDVLAVVVPRLIMSGATFKIVKPSQALRFLNHPSTQRGKMVTIYAGRWDVLGFFQDPEVEKLLRWPAFNPVPNEVQVGGLFFARFGGNTTDAIRDPRNGQWYQDDRHIPYPPFVTDLFLEDFIAQCTSSDMENYIPYHCKPVARLRKKKAYITKEDIFNAFFRKAGNL